MTLRQLITPFTQRSTLLEEAGNGNDSILFRPRSIPERTSFASLLFAFVSNTRVAALQYLLLKWDKRAANLCDR